MFFKNQLFYRNYVGNDHFWIRNLLSCVSEIKKLNIINKRVALSTATIGGRAYIMCRQRRFWWPDANYASPSHILVAQHRLLTAKGNFKMAESPSNRDLPCESKTMTKSHSTKVAFLCYNCLQVP